MMEMNTETAAIERPPTATELSEFKSKLEVSGQCIELIGLLLKIRLNCKDSNHPHPQEIFASN